MRLRKSDGEEKGTKENEERRTVRKGGRRKGDGERGTVRGKGTEENSEKKGRRKILTFEKRGRTLLIVILFISCFILQGPSPFLKSENFPPSLFLTVPFLAPSPFPRFSPSPIFSPSLFLSYNFKI